MKRLGRRRHSTHDGAAICDRIMVVHDGLIQGFDTPDRLDATAPFSRDELQLSGLR
jgi:hypothetical protein